MDARRPDASSRSNAILLQELLSPVPVVPVRWLGSGCRTAKGLASCAGSLAGILSRLVSSGRTA
jgi:hypothetical protein